MCTMIGKEMVKANLRMPIHWCTEHVLVLPLKLGLLSTYSSWSLLISRYLLLKILVIKIKASNQSRSQ